MVKPLDSFLVCKIVTLREIGLSYNQIKEKLGLKSRSTAQSAYKRFLKTSSYSPKKPPGRPEKLSKKDKRLIIRSVKNDPKTTLQRIRVKYNSFATSENIWAILKKSLQGQTLTWENLEETVIDIWNNISPEIIRNMYASYESRLVKTIKNDGNMIGY